MTDGHGFDKDNFANAQPRGSPMPLRDHFRAPLAPRYRWDMLHGGWPMKLAERLNLLLPPEYQAGPNIHLGRFEVDVAVLDERDQSAWGETSGGGGTALYTSAEPTLTLDVDPLDGDEYEVKVYRNYDLVAVVELISPSNKDHPESRDLFATKCAAFLKDGVCVTIVDVVTSYRANLFAGLLEELGWPEQTADDGIYVATLRGRRIGNIRRVNTWYYPLVVGAKLPTLPLWIGDAVAVPLELEASYEDACRGVRIP